MFAERKPKSLSEIYPSRNEFNNVIYNIVFYSRPAAMLLLAEPASMYS